MLVSEVVEAEDKLDSLIITGEEDLNLQEPLSPLRQTTNGYKFIEDDLLARLWNLLRSYS